MVFVVVSEWLAAPDYEEHKHGHCEEGEGCSWQDAQEGGEVQGDRLGLHLGRGASTGEEFQNYLNNLELANCCIYLSIVRLTYFVILISLDGVGPVDNRPSTD